MNGRQAILNKIDEALNEISITNDYNTDVQQVTSGLIVDPASYPGLLPNCLLQTRYRGQSNTPTGNEWNTGIVNYPLLASMRNVTHEDFMAFLDDIEATIANNVYGVSGEYYRLGFVYISDCRILSGNEEDFDEVMGTSGKYKELRAMLTISAEYTYIPRLLSGV